MKVAINVLFVLYALLQMSEFSICDEAHSGTLIVLEDATQVKYVKSGECDQVTYSLKGQYPAQDVIDAISTQLSEKCWEPLKESGMNPGLENSHVRGWEILAMQQPIHIAQFFNGQQIGKIKGDVVSYFLQYRNSEENLFLRKPKTNELSVFASYSPEAVVKQTKNGLRRTRINGSPLETSTIGFAGHRILHPR